MAQPHGRAHAGSIADSERAPEPRLPAPLPRALERVARANLIFFGVLVVLGALFVVCSAVAVIAFPLVLGREGVGRAMITLFLCCTSLVMTGLALLAARSAARVIRRERRGVASLRAFVRVGVILSAFAVGIVWWLNVAFAGGGDWGGSLFNWTTIATVGASKLVLFFFVWGAIVLRRRVTV